MLLFMLIFFCIGGFSIVNLEILERQKKKKVILVAGTIAIISLAIVLWSADIVFREDTYEKNILAEYDLSADEEGVFIYVVDEDYFHQKLSFKYYGETGEILYMETTVCNGNYDLYVTYDVPKVVEYQKKWDFPNSIANIIWYPLSSSKNYYSVYYPSGGLSG